MIPQLELYDICLLIIYLFVIYLGAILFVQKKKKENSVYRYFIPALSLKIAGGLVYALYHVYVYKGGDTFAYFNASADLANYFSLFDSSTWAAFYSDYTLGGDNYSENYEYLFLSKDVFFMVKCTAIIYYLSIGSYFVATLLFSLFSFLGLWSFYLVLNKLHQNSQKNLFIAFFCVPTMLLWSSGILKDTITIGALGFVVSVVANIFIFNKNKVFSFFYFLIYVYVIFILKPYIIYLLLPSLFIWVQSNIKSKIKSSFIRNLITPVLFSTIIVVSFYLLTSLSDTAGKYSLDNWESTLQGFHGWHEYLAETRDQSGYTLGEMDYTVLGVLAKFPGALNVTFFRPYLWEVRNIPTLLGALEGFLLLILSLYIFFKSGSSFFQIILKNKEVAFLLSFAIPFAFIVGLSSYNFGALSRYKIPAELFYLTALALTYKSSLTKSS
jgi:hypothetical protein